MTLETLNFLRAMLSGSTLAVGSPDFAAVAMATINAAAELDAAIAEAVAETETMLGDLASR